MTVNVNDKVRAWMEGRVKNLKENFNTKCQEAQADDLSAWRDVGKGIFDYAVDKDFRCVATKNGNTFSIKAIYNHATSGGKTKVAGETVTGY